MTLLHRALRAGFLLALTATAHAQAPRQPKVPWSRADSAGDARIYKALGYGSDAYNSPVTVLLNKGFDIFQLRRSPRDIFSFPYGNAWRYGVRGVWQNPGAAVERFGGWGRMARVELLPLSFKPDEMNWFANYTEHLIGGGLTMRGLTEWNRAHDVPFPTATAIATTYAASTLNELSEQGRYVGTAAGGVADLLIFDVAALVLFHWDQPARFLTTTLQAADWSNQAAFTFPNRQLQNNGQYFTIKVPVGLDRTRLFVRGGMGAQLGLSRRLGDGEHHVSIGGGGDTGVRDIDDSGHETVGFAPGGGIYFDRNNSLLWSVTTSPAENLLAVNVYPGVLPRIPHEMGLWAIYTRHHELRFGVVHTRALALGLGYGR